MLHRMDAKALHIQSIPFVFVMLTLLRLGCSLLSPNTKRFSTSSYSRSQHLRCAHTTRKAQLLGKEFKKMVFEPSILELTFNHIAFPPDLPGQSDDSKTNDVQNSFVTQMLHAVAKIREGVDDDPPPVWLTVENILKTSLLVNQSGFVNKKLLLGVLRGLKPGDASMIFVGQQNACVFIRKPM
jgi:hypothetical protein